jgi:hypothetical protein
MDGTPHMTATSAKAKDGNKRQAARRCSQANAMLRLQAFCQDSGSQLRPCSLELPACHGARILDSVHLPTSVRPFFVLSAPPVDLLLAGHGNVPVKGRVNYSSSRLIVGLIACPAA